MTHARFIAEKLLQIGALAINTETPFVWSSGWKSPIYCDNRKVLSHPYIRDFIKSELCNQVFEKFPEAACVAGVATAGIAWGALTADQLKLPFIYVRPKPKEHGMKNQIEGDIKEGWETVIIEDLISTGKSSLQVAMVLREAGLVVKGIVSVFEYGFPQAKAAMEEAGIQHYALSDYDTLIKYAAEKGIISNENLEILLKWQAQPEQWP
ncbi:MAG: orotate phosphoribosyltransferase [Chitinophagaceae bacterium]|nr:orotate phosphoribosyltransferase [Chitinophagaceae bacterium]